MVKYCKLLVQNSWWWTINCSKHFEDKLSEINYSSENVTVYFLIYEQPSTYCFAVLLRCNAHQKLMLTRLFKQQKQHLKVENGVKWVHEREDSSCTGKCNVLTCEYKEKAVFFFIQWRYSWYSILSLLIEFDGAWGSIMVKALCY
jgi:hypothetical protein